MVVHSTKNRYSKIFERTMNLWERYGEEYLLSLNPSQLVDVMSDVDLYVDSKIRRDLLARIFDYKYVIRTKDARKSKYAMSPEACGSGRRDSHHRIGQDTDR